MQSSGPEQSITAIRSSLMLTLLFAGAALGLSFAVTFAELPSGTRAVLFVLIGAVYIFASAVLYLNEKRRIQASAERETAAAAERDVETKLLILEEANEFFGASLKPADMFRLAASRIREIVPFAALVLCLPDNGDRALKIRYAFGDGSAGFLGFDGDLFRSLAVKSYLSRKPVADPELLFDRRVFPGEMTAGLGSATAVPLMRATEAFGVLVFYSLKGEVYTERQTALAESVANRVAPLFSGSISFENSIANAMTDRLTNLPNERGFFLVLENQLAESIRYRDERPLTVLAADIRDFDEMNRRFGHAVGDEILEFVASVLKSQLRQMDVLTRSGGDEFLAVLPTAGEAIAEDVKERIRIAFASNPFARSNGERFHVGINCGTATFWRDGENAADLLKVALLRKHQDKSAEPGNVIWFPREFVN